MKDNPFCFIWDLDGTIIDSLEQHYLSWVSALQTHGVCLTKEKFTQNFGTNNRNSLRAYLGYEPGEAFYKAITEEKERIYRQRIKYAKPFPGVLECLDFFYGSGIKQAIASSAPIKNIDAAIDAFNLVRYFDAIIPGSNLPSKPAPDIFLKAAESLGCDPCLCVVMEDSIAGLAAAEAAGMISVGVANTQPLAEIKATICIESFQISPNKLLKDIKAAISQGG